MWAEPPDELEDRVVAAIADAAGTSPATEPTKHPGPRQFATPVQPAHVRRAAQEAQASQPPQPPPPARQAPPAQPTRQIKKPRRERSWVITILERPAYAFGLLAVLVAVIAGATLISRSGGGSPSPAPLKFAMVVDGTSLAPGAHG